MEGREWRFALTISAAHGMDHFLKRVFPPLVPIWGLAFGFPLWKLGVILGARSFGSAIGQAPMGHLSDRFDRRVILPAGIALMGVSFVVFAALPYLSLDVAFSVAGVSMSGEFLGMLLTMVAAGLGSSTLHPTGYPLISENVGEARKGKVLGMWGSARAFGDGTAPAVVGVALLLTGWQPILVGFGLLGLAYAGYLYVVLGAFETRPPDHVEGRTETTDDAPSLWRADRRRYVYPMLAVFAAFVLQITATAGVNVFLPEFITSEYSYSLSLAGFTVTPTSTASFYYSALLLTAGVVQLGTGELVDRYDHRKVLVGFLVTGALVLLILATSAFSPIVLFGVLLLLGASLWGLNPARDAIVSDIAPAAHEGRTFGYLWTGALLLASASPAVVGYIGDVAGLRQAFAVLAGIVFLSVIPIALLLSSRVYLDSGATDVASGD
jgi:MFS family permease